MLLTIIIPAWNAEKTLDECLNSIFAQTVSDFEVRIVNDGSTDGSRRLLAEWAVRFSLSPHTTEEEIDYAADRIGVLYGQLKRFQRR